MLQTELETLDNEIEIRRVQGQIRELRELMKIDEVANRVIAAGR